MTLKCVCGFVAALVWLAACAGSVAAAEAGGNWPQWRGPSANGVATGDPPTTWSETKNVKWKVPLPGKGSATPIVWEDRIFVLTAEPAVKDDAAAGGAASEPRGERSEKRGEGQPGRRPGRGGPGGGFGRSEAPQEPWRFVVLCLNRADGSEIWRRVAAEEVPHEGHHQTNTFASGSPVTDGTFVWASFGSRGVFCYDMDGNLKWKRDLGDMQTRNGFGEGSSPALYGDTLVVPWDHEGKSFIAALDARTGETRWEADRKERSAWATPLMVEHEGRVQVVTNGATRVRSYDLATGELIWECGGQTGNPIAMPVTLDGVVFVVTGFRGQAVYAIPLDAKGDITGTETVAWKRTDTGSYVASPVLHGELLYVTKGQTAILWCLNVKTGETLYGPERLPGLETLYASPVAVGDRLYYTGRDGTTVVVKHGPKFEVLATNTLGEGIDASPVVVGEQMFLRGEKSLYCLEE